MSPVEHGRDLAKGHLVVLPRRWSHVQAVAAQAEDVAQVFGKREGDVLVTAAWLHDIGYAPDVADTGFHPLDGARFLRRAGVGVRVTALVAHHSCALLEAEERGLDDRLAAEFPREESAVADALWYCDMTTGPDGQRMRPQGRIAEIKSRYGPDDVVTRFITRAEPELLLAAKRTRERLDARVSG